MTTEQGGTRQVRKIAVDTQDLPLRGSRLTQIICASLWPSWGIWTKRTCKHLALTRRVASLDPIGLTLFLLFVLRPFQSGGCIFSCDVNIYPPLFLLVLPSRGTDAVFARSFVRRERFDGFVLYDMLPWVGRSQQGHLRLFNSPPSLFSQSVLIPSCVSFRASLVFNGHNTSQ